MVDRTNPISSILIVDDSEDTMALLSSTLSDTFKVFEATNGEEAFKLYKEHKPDIVLMDIVMPIKNGIDSTKQIIGYDPDAVILGMTGWRTEDRKEILEAGAKSLLDKPFKHELLLSEIESYLEGVSDNIDRQRLYTLERGFAHIQSQIVDMRCDVEAIRVQNENFFKRFFSSTKKGIGSGVLGYNLITLLIFIIGRVNNNSDFVIYIMEHPEIAVLSGIGILLLLIFFMPIIYKKIRRKPKEETDNTLWVYNKVFEKPISKPTKKRRLF